MGRVYPILLKSNYQYFSSWEVVRQEEVLKLKEIFDMKPLNTSKYLDYLDWLHIFNLQQTHSLTTLYLEEAIKIRKNFNSTRTTYTWDHLNNCYLSKPRSEERRVGKEC